MLAYRESLGRIRNIVLTADSYLAALEDRYALDALRYSITVVFVWFGIVKSLGMAPVTMLVRETLAATLGLRAVVPVSIFLPVLGWGEVLIGVGLLFHRTIRLAVAGMIVHIDSTFAPLIMLPEIPFHSQPFVPTTTGFYIVKNVVLLTGGLVVAASTGRGANQRWSGAANRLQYSPRLQRVSDQVQDHATDWLQSVAPDLLRKGVVLVFLWSGLVTITTTAESGHWIAAAVPSAFVTDQVFIPLLGVLELAIGPYLIADHTARITTYLTLIYLLLSMLPLVIAPAAAYETFPLALTFEGLYLVKNWVLANAVLVVNHWRPNV